MKRFYISTLAAAAILSLSGCGGGGGSSAPAAATVTGQFIDAAVAGLDYTCSGSGKVGVTNAEGEYTCNEGDSVEFSLGGYVLGSVTAANGIVTPYTLSPSDVKVAINIAQLLQTIDEDGDPTNGITISEEMKAKVKEADVALTDGDFDTVMGSVLGETLVSEQDAVEHLTESIASIANTDLKALLAGKTFYAATQEEGGQVESWKFDADAKTVTWTTMMGGNDSGKATVDSIDGMTITVSEDRETSQITIKTVMNEYITVEISGTEDGVAYTRTERLYYDAEKAKTFASGGTVGIQGVWKHFVDSTKEFEILALLPDGAFLYAEHDPNADEAAGENGLEVGTYSSSATQISFDIKYDDNAPGNDSGIGDIGGAVAVPAVMSPDGQSLTVAGELGLNRVSLSAKDISGVWAHTNGEEFEYLIIMDDGTFLYAENDPSASEPENGVEVGTYTAASGSITFTVKYDDNAPGNDSGIGDPNVPVTINVTVSGNTMNIAGLTLTKIL